MDYKYFLTRIMPIVFTILITACGAPSTPVLIPTETITPIHITETPTSTSTPEPTNTPTITPTPIGGKSGLLLSQPVCSQDGDCIERIFLYNLISHEFISFLDGYYPLDVSPDGKKVLLLGTKDLFILDLTKPEQITLLQENVGGDAFWLGDSGWIGFISKVNDKGQVFLIHPDGSDLMQVTHSSVGVVKLEPVFNDGVFWGEGKVSSRGTQIDKFKWTKLDGTETQFTNFLDVSHSGKYIITLSLKQNRDCRGCTLEITDLSIGETKKISISKPDPNMDSFQPGFQPLSDDKWLIEKFTTSTTNREFWIYSSDGNVLTKLPNEYEVTDPSDPPQSYDLLSPDGVWVLVNDKETYYLFNTTTSEIKDLPNLHFTNTQKNLGRDKYFWVEMP